MDSNAGDTQRTGISYDADFNRDTSSLAASDGQRVENPLQSHESAFEDVPDDLESGAAGGAAKRAVDDPHRRGMSGPEHNNDPATVCKGNPFQRGGSKRFSPVSEMIFYIAFSAILAIIVFIVVGIGGSLETLALPACAEGETALDKAKVVCVDFWVICLIIFHLFFWCCCAGGLIWAVTFHLLLCHNVRPYFCHSDASRIPREANECYSVEIESCGTQHYRTSQKMGTMHSDFLLIVPDADCIYGVEHITDRDLDEKHPPYLAEATSGSTIVLMTTKWRERGSESEDAKPTVAASKAWWTVGGDTRKILRKEPLAVLLSLTCDLNREPGDRRANCRSTTTTSFGCQLAIQLEESALEPIVNLKSQQGTGFSKIFAFGKTLIFPRPRENITAPPRDVGSRHSKVVAEVAGMHVVDGYNRTTTRVYAMSDEWSVALSADDPTTVELKRASPDTAKRPPSLPFADALWTALTKIPVTDDVAITFTSAKQAMEWRDALKGAIDIVEGRARQPRIPFVPPPMAPIAPTAASKVEIAPGKFELQTSAERAVTTAGGGMYAQSTAAAGVTGRGCATPAGRPAFSGDKSASDLDMEENLPANHWNA